MFVSVQPTMLTSKIITECVENHSECFVAVKWW